MAVLPGVTYDAEFRTLAQARSFFGIPGRRERKVEALAARIAALRRDGKSQAEIGTFSGQGLLRGQLLA
jgi:hypothetical protein